MIKHHGLTLRQYFLYFSQFVSCLMFQSPRLNVHAALFARSGGGLCVWRWEMFSLESVLSPLFTSDLPAVRDNKDVTEASSFWNIFSHDYWGVNITSERSHKEIFCQSQSSNWSRVFLLQSKYLASRARFDWRDWLKDILSPTDLSQLSPSASNTSW